MFHLSEKDIFSHTKAVHTLNITIVKFSPNLSKTLIVSDNIVNKTIWKNLLYS